jgi:hypothetical protein
MLEKIAQRYAFDRPGYRLVDFTEVGLPVYRLALLASFLEEKPIPALHEFVLRTAHSGITNDQDIANFLGLDLAHIVQVLAELDTTELIAIEPTGNGSRHVSLTSKGLKSIARSMTVTPKLGEIVLHFDGLTRRLVPPRAEALWQYRQLAAAGIREIAAKPPKRPTLAEVSIQDARQISLQLSELRGKSKRELLAIKAIENSSRMFQIGQVLLYRSLNDGDADFSVVVDGAVSAAHKDAIIRAGGLRRFGIDSDDLARPPELSIVSRLDESQKAELREGSEEAARTLEEAYIAAASDADGAQDVSQKDDQASRDKMVQDAIDAAIGQLKTVHIRYLEVFEHPPYLDDAFKSSQRRLLIISPWIRRQVLDARRLRSLRERLDAGCKVYIGWGIGKEDRATSNDMDVVTQLQNLHKEYANFYFVDLDNTHEKVLIKDSDYVITTSFNWLSFKGDPKRTLRFERGVYMGLRDFVDDQFNELVTRFETAKDIKPSSSQLDALKQKFGR